VAVDQNVTYDHTFEVVTKIFVEHEFSRKFLNLSPQTLMSSNGVNIAHYIGCVTKLALTTSPGALPNTMGLTIP
jgi:hypothetical protein